MARFPAKLAFPLGYRPTVAVEPLPPLTWLGSQVLAGLSAPGAAVVLSGLPGATSVINAGGFSHPIITVEQSPFGTQVQDPLAVITNVIAQPGQVASQVSTKVTVSGTRVMKRRNN